MSAITTEAGFARTTRPLMHSLRGFALRLTCDTADADDLVQDTMLRAWRFRSSYVDQGTGRAWMFTIMRNAWASTCKARACRPTTQGETRHATPVEAIHDGGTLESDIAEERETAADRRALVLAVANLTPVYRDVIRAVDLHEMTYSEAANALGIPTGTVMSRLHRGRKALRAAMVR